MTEPDPIPPMVEMPPAEDPGHPGEGVPTLPPVGPPPPVAPPPDQPPGGEDPFA